jgi:hypothetical protein
MAILSVEDYKELENGIDKLYDSRTKNLPDYMSQLFTVSDTDSIEERHMGIGAMSKMVPWGGVVVYDGYAKGYETDYRQTRYVAGIQLEERIFRYKQFKEIGKRTIKAADAVYKTIQYYAFSVFMNAFNDAYTSRKDSVGLCSTAHPYSPSDTAHTQSNEDTLSLTVANFETVRKRMLQFVDDKGDVLVGTIPNILLCGVENEKTARQIIGSNEEAYITDHALNIYKGEFQVMISPFITDKKWFMIAGMEMSNNLNWYWGRRPKPEREEDFDTEVVKFKLIGDFAYGWDDYTWIYGNNPTS